MQLVRPQPRPHPKTQLSRQEAASVGGGGGEEEGRREAGREAGGGSPAAETGAPSPPRPPELRLQDLGPEKGDPGAEEAAGQA